MSLEAGNGSLVAWDIVGVVHALGRSTNSTLHWPEASVQGWFVQGQRFVSRRSRVVVPTIRDERGQTLLRRSPLIVWRNEKMAGYSFTNGREQIDGNARLDNIAKRARGEAGADKIGI